MKAIIMCSVLLLGCVQLPTGVKIIEPGETLPPIQQIYSVQLSKLSIGTSLNDFQNIVPRSYVAGQNNRMIAYQLDHSITYISRAQYDYAKIMGISFPYQTTQQILWFYFYNEVLVSWGRPQDWPERPDLIIEERHR